MEQTNTSSTQTIVVVSKQKSMGLALILTILFGPLGLLYASIAGGITMIILGAIIGFVTLGFGLIVVWLASVVWAVVAVSMANKKTRAGQI